MTERPATSANPFGPELWETLARYVAGESSAAEADAVRRWLAEDPGRTEIMSILKRSVASVSAVPPVVDVEAALRRVSRRLATPEVVELHPNRWRSTGLRAAAAIALVVAGALVWRQVSQRGPASGPVAAAQVYSTPPGRSDSIRFADGSTAVLGPGSTLQVAAGYGDAVRSMELQGVALFEVVHDESRPFTVRAGAGLIEDIGTVFTVRVDGDEETSVVVTEGSVRLQQQGAGSESRNGEESVVLEAGDRGRVTRGGRPVVERSAASPDDLAWTRGRLVFDDAPLSRVRADIRRWYGVDLQVVDSALAQRHLTASFTAEPVEQVLRVIGLALGASVERRGNAAVLRAR